MFSDELKFIFKSLMRVPIIIFVSFFVLNIFTFMFVYFKALGISYVVMQTVVENNYIPQSELVMLVDYLKDMEMGSIEHCGIVIDDSNTCVDTDNYLTMPSTGALKKEQYGNEVTCGVQFTFKLIWPLNYRETTTGDSGVTGLNDTDTFSGFEDDTKLEEKRAKKGEKNPLTFNITYKVPGLKYYPDML